MGLEMSGGGGDHSIIIIIIIISIWLCYSNVINILLLRGCRVSGGWRSISRRKMQVNII